MGCGVSSGTQISPIGAEVSPTSDLYNGNCSKTNSSWPNTLRANSSQSRHGIPFHLGLLFPCRFYSTNSPSVSNGNLAGKLWLNREVQTDNDILGFKCQYSQTDSNILSEAELEAMIEELEKEVNQAQPGQSTEGQRTVTELEAFDELLDSHKTWRNLIKVHRGQLENEKQFANVAVQATKPKATNATQTKFGSIDHQFVPKSYDEILDQNELLTKTISENLSKVIEKPDMFDQKLTALLTSLDEDDSPVLDGSTDQIVNSLQKTFAEYGGKNEQEKKEIKQRATIIANGHVVSNNIGVESGNKKERWVTNSRRLMKQQKFQDCLSFLLKDIRNKNDDFLPSSVPTVKKRDVSLQTTNDILTDEAPEYAARPPLCHKNEMIPSVHMFREIDRKMQDAPQFDSIYDIANYASKVAKNDLFKIRALFTWITDNIRYNFKAAETNRISSEILESRDGVSKDYCQLFGDLCRIVGVRVKKIEGFVRGYDYRPGHHFTPGLEALSCWNAVFVLSSWRFIDLTLAAGFTDASGEYHPKKNEDFFLTDPNVMIWTHFPWSELENNYERWQLLDKPLSLAEFNALPKVTEFFFEYNLNIRSKIQNPLEFRISTEIKIGGHEAMRFKYKLYPAEEIENSSLNHYVFCQLKEDRLVGSFMVSPPLEGRFYLKVFAKPEREMHGSQQDLSASLNPILTMLLDCTKSRRYIEPFPINDLPWGPTQKFYDYKLKLINQKGPIVVTWGGRRRLVMESNETMLLTYSLFDGESMEMDVRSIISRDDNGFKTTFTINPPRVGTFKFMLFGMPKPKQKGKWRLPLLATFMIDCKLIKPPQHDEDMLAPSNSTDDKTDKKQQKGKK